MQCVMRTTPYTMYTMYSGPSLKRLFKERTPLLNEEDTKFWQQVL